MQSKQNEFIFECFSSGCVKIPDDLKHSVDDNDVAAERQRIYSDPTNQSGDILRMLDLIKVRFFFSLILIKNEKQTKFV